ncbi:hypothetical protein [Actinopolyspora erythraea]|uniref:hypothetical protein n=1 Tax=Actinopolyspora erythraea TaxID=414996 RepID=UPI0011856386|nr:hypothetical protein [Actinopolyspora erythraea]
MNTAVSLVRRIGVLALAVLFFFSFSAVSAIAQQPTKEVTEVKVNESLTLTMNEPITEKRSQEIKRSLSGEGTAQASPDALPTLGCGQERVFSDENGTWRVRFQCLPEYGVVN